MIAMYILVPATGSTVPPTVHICESMRAEREVQFGENLCVKRTCRSEN